MPGGRPKRSRDVECICQGCSKRFIVPEWIARKGGGKFCSRQCAGPYRAPIRKSFRPLEKVCPVCQGSFLVGGRGRRMRKQVFCSNRCAGRHRWMAGKAPFLRGGSERGWGLGKQNSGLEASRKPTAMQIAWAAGIYEGEGSCRRAKACGGSENVNVGQKDPWLCHRFREFFGGSINSRMAKGIMFYTWHVHGSRARGFLMTIFTFLSPRRRTQIRATLL